MCNLSNEVPQLFDWNNQTNQPADRWGRAELNSGVVEFVAPQEYMVSRSRRSRGVSGPLVDSLAVNEPRN